MSDSIETNPAYSHYGRQRKFIFEQKAESNGLGRLRCKPYYMSDATYAKWVIYINTLKIYATDFSAYDRVMSPAAFEAIERAFMENVKNSKPKANKFRVILKRFKSGIAALWRLVLATTIR